MALSAGAYPTIFGDTGLVQVPTADVQPLAQFDVAANATRVSNEQSGHLKVGIYPLRVNYGLSTDTELSAVISESQGDDTESFDILGGGLKLGLLHEDLSWFTPGIAVGLRIDRVKIFSSNYRESLDGYAVVSKTLLALGMRDDEKSLLRAHVGASYIRFTDDDNECSFVAPFLGVSYDAVDGKSLVVDYIPELKDDAMIYRQEALSAALRHPITPELIFEVGYTKPFGYSDSSSYYVGADYHFDGRQ